MTREKKTNHQPGYHKPVKNPTTNCPKDTHKDFCRRCIVHNRFCPANGRDYPSRSCSL